MNNDIEWDHRLFDSIRGALKELKDGKKELDRKHIEESMNSKENPKS